MTWAHPSACEAAFNGAMQTDNASLQGLTLTRPSWEQVLKGMPFFGKKASILQQAAAKKGASAAPFFKFMPQQMPRI
jgi:hypothetical protein